ncbi:MAG: MFS transporter [Aquificae bacterium]|nr:MFS transporter [Aquificota bacterium]
MAQIETTAETLPQTEISSKTKEESKKRLIFEYYTKEDYILNRRVTILYGLTFMFIFFSAVMSEILSLVFNEGLLSPVQVIFHTVSFIGYSITFYYVYKKQDYIEEKNTEIFKKQEVIDKEALKSFED